MSHYFLILELRVIEARIRMDATIRELLRVRTDLLKDQ